MTNQVNHESINDNIESVVCPGYTLYLVKKNESGRVSKRFPLGMYTDNISLMYLQPPFYCIEMEDLPKFLDSARALHYIVYEGASYLHGVVAILVPFSSGKHGYKSIRSNIVLQHSGIDVFVPFKERAFPYILTPNGEKLRDASKILANSAVISSWSSNTRYLKNTKDIAFIENIEYLLSPTSYPLLDTPRNEGDKNV